jgi:5-methylcytosine-specific restriction endonuclease McrA
VQRVFALDHKKNPLMPCRPSRAKELLKTGKAAVFKRYPFTIIMKVETGKEAQPVAFKIDPGSKTTGIALVADFKRGKTVVWAGELEHRGQAIVDKLLSRKMLRHGRRGRKCRYRQLRFDNRRKPQGWLHPSLESRIFNIMTWLAKVRRATQISSISVELAKFDTQKMMNPEISGIEYKQGVLQGYEVREYLLEKWGRKCAYCGANGIPLQIEHIVPKSRGGSNRVSNLTISCEPCNTKKGPLTAAEFGHPEVQAQAKENLKDAAAMNATRWALYGRLRKAGLPLECGTGARTKFNRTKLGLPKVHWVDAACVGVSGENVIAFALIPLRVKAVGRGKRQRCQTDAFGFPKAHAKRAKTFQGWQSGDIARAMVPSGKYAGTFIGKVVIRHRPKFTVGKIDVHLKHLVRLHRGDGYNYA